MEKMLNYKCCRLLFLLIVYQIKVSNGAYQVTCTMSENNRKCTISGLTLTLQKYSFVPVAPYSRSVTKFEIKNSVVPVLTSDICTTFTELDSFVAIRQNVEVLEDYAFYNCTEIKKIVLDYNNIHKLGKGVFSNSRQLQTLDIFESSLEQIDVDLFANLMELNHLQLAANGLKELPVAAVRNLKKLQKLIVFSNDLSDLDVEGLIENLPSLQNIYINDNNFPCDRLIEIIKSFKAQDIFVVDYATYSKKRDYTPLMKMDKILCLTQAQLQSEKVKMLLTKSPEKLKEFPIAREVTELKDVVASGFADSHSNMVALSSTFDETSDSLNEQISNLKETLQNEITFIGDAVTDLKVSVSNQISEQRSLEAKLKATSAKLHQEIADSVALMRDKVVDKLESSKKSNENSNQAYGSLADVVDGLKISVSNQILEQQSLEARLNATSAKLYQEIADSVVLMTDKHNIVVNNLETSNKLHEDNKQAYESLSNAVNGLKENLSNQIVEQQALEANVNITSVKFQEITDVVKSLKENVLNQLAEQQNQFAEQQNREAKLNAKLQEITDSVALMMRKYILVVDKLETTNKLYEESKQTKQNHESMSNAVTSLKENSNQFAEQQILEAKFNAKLQEMADSVALMTDKYNKLHENSKETEAELNAKVQEIADKYNKLVDNVVTSNKLNERSSQAIGVFVCKRYRNVYADVPIVCYVKTSGP